MLTHRVSLSLPANIGVIWVYLRSTIDSILLPTYLIYFLPHFKLTLLSLSMCYLFYWSSCLLHKQSRCQFNVSFTSLGPVTVSLSMCHIKLSTCFNVPFPTSFSLFLSFLITIPRKYGFNKSCRWLDSNRGPLVSEATALSTEPQPLSTSSSIYNHHSFAFKLPKVCLFNSHSVLVSVSPTPSVYLAFFVKQIPLLCLCLFRSFYRRLFRCIVPWSIENHKLNHVPAELFSLMCPFSASYQTPQKNYFRKRHRPNGTF